MIGKIVNVFVLDNECSMLFKCVTSFNPHNNPIFYVPLLPSFYGKRNLHQNYTTTKKKSQDLLK